MVELEFPKYPFRFKSRENKRLVFDFIRKKYVLLQPEEWVRQHCLHYLVRDRGYPAGRILVERELRVGSLRKRVDIAVCNPRGDIDLLVECKAPSVALNQEVFDQIARYNLKARSRYLMVTNGLLHIFCRMDYESERFVYLRELPPYPFPDEPAV
ncbi:type I restriction enzyme HsdR N-terminal domain-containing protein [Robiginitalea sp. SC105]|uniref:type I restriction enzyme HsdR N-terminal domain-containing protein n=1 Tax=Robiginitalea sp. SC105 TaxID=2762332 RepID=UPI00163A6000|nr:type I restriction enzyme HsdR N-terminal domain-containing protein [Robiginitalea sp. SC105]MBC2840479.1 type I restriction enzyme HsdR N-terminal domain-containing protein [Robiginitalea sp. SC105]